MSLGDLCVIGVVMLILIVGIIFGDRYGRYDSQDELLEMDYICFKRESIIKCIELKKTSYRDGWKVTAN